MRHAVEVLLLLAEAAKDEEGVESVVELLFNQTPFVDFNT